MEQAGKKYLLIIPTIVVSCYFFPFEFTFLPEGINTKMMLAVTGILWACGDCLNKSRASLNKDVMIATLIAIVFSLVGFIAVEQNNTDDFTYSLYLLSFATWLGGAYATFRVLRLFHTEVTLKLAFNYLILISVLQCILALTIDLVEPFKVWVDAYISQSTIADDEYLAKIERLYGIGATLDVAGVRFSVVLLGLAALVAHDPEIRKNHFHVFSYFVAFLIICIIGNMMSRTTSVGMLMASGYFLCAAPVFRAEIKRETIILCGKIFLAVVILFFTVRFFYAQNTYLHDFLRFGFEGFFNWIEQGEWRTDSTDKLNRIMWLWPEDLKTWLIGKGNFSYKGTDIGYCRLIFYSGIAGLALFSVFFVYNAVSCAYRFPSYKTFFAGLLLLGFIVWLKVATDLFVIYALLYCIDEEKETAV